MAKSGKEARGSSPKADSFYTDGYRPGRQQGGWITRDNRTGKSVNHTHGHDLAPPKGGTSGFKAAARSHPKKDS